MPAIEATIFELLRSRAPEKSICPSEVARHLWPEDWRDHMEEVRTIARHLAQAGRIRITQQERVWQGESDWTGPIRLRLPQD